MISIIYITCRWDCKFDYFINSLYSQIKADTPPIQLVIVDSILTESDNEGRREYIHCLIQNRFEYIHIPPKPTPWQGPYRITQKDYFCAANPRNTGVCYAKYDYIAFVDDLGVLSPSWLNQVLHGQSTGRIYCGAYTKMSNMDVSNGILLKGTAESGDIDNRLSYYKTDITVCHDSHMYGSSFCMPLSIFLDVNGLNEECDSCGGEDYEFGIRLARKGHQLFYNKHMFIHESKDISLRDSIITKCRIDPDVSRDTFHQLLRKRNVQIPLTSINHRPDFSHFLLYLARHGPVRVNPDFNLSEYRAKIIEGNSMPFFIPIKTRTHPLLNTLLCDM